MSIPKGPITTKVADGVYDITRNKGTGKKEVIEKNKVEFKPYATGLVKSQINESNKNRPVRPAQVPILNLKQLSQDETDLIINESIAKDVMDIKETMGKIDLNKFNELYSEEDEVPKNNEDLKKT